MRHASDDHQDRAAGLLLALMLLASAPAAAQTPLPAGLSLSNPGARSLGFGGAFVAIADDASAAYSNPAGLVQLLRPEVSFELRFRAETEEGLPEEVGAADGFSFGAAVVPLGPVSLAYSFHSASSADFEPGSDELRPTSQVDVRRHAFSLGVRLSERLSVGGGASRFDAKLQQTAIADADASDWGLNAGLLWRPGERVRLGAFYREGPRFDLDGTALLGVERYALPDSFGVGAAMRSRRGALLLSAEWDRVRTSRLLRLWSPAPPASGRFVLEDGDEVHIGGEYAFLRVRPAIAVRLGGWLEPDNRLRYEGPDAALAAHYPRGERRVHGAAGIGLAWPRWQLDFGLDVASRVAAFSLAAVVSF